MVLVIIVRVFILTWEKYFKNIFMQKLLISAFLFSILLGCSKSKDLNLESPYYLNAIIKNVKYSTNSVATFKVPNQKGCLATRVYDVTNIGQINVDDYYLDCYMKHYTNNVDFVNTKTGTRKIFDGGLLLSSSSCNGDLIIGLVDNNIPNLFNNTVLEPTNIVHNLTSIIKKDSTSASMTYVVSGNFSCNFKNTNNEIIPVVGSYSFPVKVAK
jgi:hypothetical protein